MKKFITSLFALALIISCSGVQEQSNLEDASRASAQNGDAAFFEGHVLMNELPERPEVVQEAKVQASMHAVVLAADAPKSVDLAYNLPPVRNQGSIGSCVGWSTAYYCKTNLEQRARNWGTGTTNHQFSPMYIYNQFATNPNEGMYVSDALKTLVQQGCDTVDNFPIQTNGSTWVRTLPDGASRARAANYKATGYKTLGNNLNAMKNELITGNPLIFAIPVYPDFELNSSNQVYDAFSGYLSGYHAICIIGYDDSRQAFRFVNSWGTGYGSSGYGWVSYSILNLGSFSCSVLYGQQSTDQPATSIVSGATYELVPASATSKALDLNAASTADGAKIQQWGRNGSNAQRWRIYDMGNGLKFINVASGKALDIPGSNAYSGQKVQQWTDNGTSAQRFGSAHLGNGVWKFWTVFNGGLCFDISGASTADGAQVQIWSDNGTNAQRWILYKR